MLGSIVDVSHIGYPLLFLLVTAESGGVPVPGETALIGGAVLASRGQLKIELVIALAAVAAITGDNIGYLIGRKGGRWLLERPGRFQRQRLQVLATGEPFFERHGPKAVFFGASCWACACGHRGWPVPRVCRGAHSRSGTRVAASAGRPSWDCSRIFSAIPPATRSRPSASTAWGPSWSRLALRSSRTAAIVATWRPRARRRRLRGTNVARC